MPLSDFKAQLKALQEKPPENIDDYNNLVEEIQKEVQGSDLRASLEGDLLLEEALAARKKFLADDVKQKLDGLNRQENDLKEKLKNEKLKPEQNTGEIQRIQNELNKVQLQQAQLLENDAKLAGEDAIKAATSTGEKAARLDMFVENENASIEAQIKESEGELQKLKEDRNRLTPEKQVPIDNAIKDREKYQATMQERQQENTQLGEKIAALDANVVTQRQIIKDQQNIITDHTKEIEELNNQIQEKINTAPGSIEAINRLKTERRILSAKRDAAKTKIDNASNSIMHTSAQLDDCRLLLSYNAKRSENLTKAQALRAEILNSENAIQEKQANIKKLEDVIAEKTQEKETIKQTIAALQAKEPPVENAAIEAEKEKDKECDEAIAKANADLEALRKDDAIPKTQEALKAQLSELEKADSDLTPPKPREATPPVPIPVVEPVLEPEHDAEVVEPVPDPNQPVIEDDLDKEKEVDDKDKEKEKEKEEETEDLEKEKLKDDLAKKLSKYDPKFKQEEFKKDLEKVWPDYKAEVKELITSPLSFDSKADPNEELGKFIVWLLMALFGLLSTSAIAVFKAAYNKSGLDNALKEFNSMTAQCENLKELRDKKDKLLNGRWTKTGYKPGIVKLKKEIENLEKQKQELIDEQLKEGRNESSRQRQLELQRDIDKIDHRLEKRKAELKKDQEKLDKVEAGIKAHEDHLGELVKKREENHDRIEQAAGEKIKNAESEREKSKVEIARAQDAIAKREDLIGANIGKISDLDQSHPDYLKDLAVLEEHNRQLRQEILSENNKIQEAENNILEQEKILQGAGQETTARDRDDELTMAKQMLGQPVKPKLSPTPESIELDKVDEAEMEAIGADERYKRGESPGGDQDLDQDEIVEENDEQPVPLVQVKAAQIVEKADDADNEIPPPPNEPPPNNLDEEGYVIPPPPPDKVDAKAGQPQPSPDNADKNAEQAGAAMVNAAAKPPEMGEEVIEKGQEAALVASTGGASTAAAPAAGAGGPSAASGAAPAPSPSPKDSTKAPSKEEPPTVEKGDGEDKKPEEIIAALAEVVDKLEGAVAAVKQAVGALTEPTKGGSPTVLTGYNSSASNGPKLKQLPKGVQPTPEQTPSPETPEKERPRTKSLP